MANIVGTPYEIFLDNDGMPLEAGYIYVGVSGMNAETNQVPTFWDESLTIPASQPIRTSNGVPVYLGSPGRLFTAQGYSLVVKDKAQQLVFSALSQSNSVLETVYDSTTQLFASQEQARGAGTVWQAGRYSYTEAAPTAVDALDIQGDGTTTAGGVKLYAESPLERITIPSAMQFSDAGLAELPGLQFTQADGAELTTLAQVALTNSTQSDYAKISLNVDGNRDNNTTAVTGILVDLFRKGGGFAELSAVYCDTGVRITDNVEYAQFKIGVDYCGTGVLIDTDDGTTPDEMILDISGHECTTFFEASGTNKMTGVVTFACEQCDSYGARFEQGWWQVSGVLRGVGRVSDGGVLISGDAQVAGTLRVLGASDVNCEWLLDVQGGFLQNLTVIAGTSFANGGRILGGTQGALTFVMAQAPTPGGTGLKLGDSAGSALVGFHLLPGSYMTSGADVLDLDNCNSCVLDGFFSGNITIGAGSFDNTIYISRRSAEAVTFTNNRTAEDNKIIFRGTYTRAQMNAFNGGTAGSGCIKGMEVEACENFNFAPAWFDGTQWVPVYGTLFSTRVTVLDGTATISAPHGLTADPGNAFLRITPEDNMNGVSWWGNVNATSVIVNTDGNVTGDKRFQVVLEYTKAT